MSGRSVDYQRHLQRRRAYFSDYLPWKVPVAPGVIVNDDDSLQATLQLVGPDLRAQPPDVQGAAMLLVHNALQAIDLGWSLHSTSQRFEIPPPAPSPYWGHPVAQYADEERLTRFAQKPLLESRHYVTLRYAPPSQTMAWLEGLTYAEGQRPHLTAPWLDYLAAFQSTVAHMAMLLRGVIVDVQALDDTGVFNFLDSALNFQWRKLVLPEDTYGLAEILDQNEDWYPGTRPMRAGKYIRTITLGRFPSTSVAVMLAKLNELDIPYQYVLRWIPFDQYTADKTMQKQQEVNAFHRKSVFRQMMDKFWGDSPGGVNPMADVNTNEVMDAREWLGTQFTAFGTLTVTVSIAHEDWLTSESMIRAVESAINGLGFKARVEKSNAVSAYAGSLPGIISLNPVKPITHALTATHLMAIDAPYGGLSWDKQWNCAPLFVVTTAKSNAYRYVPHPDKEAGAHTLIWGPTGYGKSGRLAKIRLACQRVPEMQDLGQDFKGSSKVLTWCLGGTFDDLGKGDVSLQPYRYIDRPSERDFYYEWTLKLLRERGVDFDQYGEGFLRRGLERLAAVEPAGRTWTGMVHVLINATVHPKGEARLHKVDEDEVHRIRQQHDRIIKAMKLLQGGALDGDHDGLQFSRVHTFELEELFKTPEKAKAIMRHVNHRIDERLDGRPTILWYDELQAMLDDEESTDTLNLRLRRLRDKNVMLVCASQNVEDILLHKLGLVFANNCENLIFLPNGQALGQKNVELYEALGLTYGHCRQLHSGQPRAEFLLKNSLGIRMCEDRFDPFMLAVAGRSGKQWHAEADALYAAVGPELFPSAWVRSQGCHEAADWLDRQREVGHAAD